VQALGDHCLRHIAHHHDIGKLAHAIEEGPQEEEAKHSVFEVDCDIQKGYLMLPHIVIVRLKHDSVFSVESDDSIDD